MLLSPSPSEFHSNQCRNVADTVPVAVDSPLRGISGTFFSGFRRYVSAKKPEPNARFNNCIFHCFVVTLCVNGKKADGAETMTGGLNGSARRSHTCPISLSVQNGTGLRPVSHSLEGCYLSGPRPLLGSGASDGALPTYE